MTHTVCIRDSCIGVGVCESVAPDIFVLGDAGRSQVRVDGITEESIADAREAADSCPMSAIEIDGE